MFGLTYMNARHRNASVVFLIFLSLWVAAMLGLIFTNIGVFAVLGIPLTLATAFTILCFDVMPVSNQTKEMILARRAVRSAETNNQLQKLAALKSIALKEGQQPVWFGQATKWVDEHDSPQEAILLLEMLQDQAQANLRGPGA